jgi:cardiolipin synthase
VTFWLISVGDYVDGFLARATGQYSRMGALLDPVVDRLTILCGVVVCWHFELLPRWALAILIVREALMVVVVLAGLRLGLDLEINWTGRLAVWPTMTGLGLALVTDSWVAEACLYVGIAGSIAASVLYLRDGLAALRTR